MQIPYHGVSTTTPDNSLTRFRTQHVRAPGPHTTQKHVPLTHHFFQDLRFGHSLATCPLWWHSKHFGPFCPPCFAPQELFFLFSGCSQLVFQVLLGARCCQPLELTSSGISFCKYTTFFPSNFSCRLTAFFNICSSVVDTWSKQMRNTIQQQNLHPTKHTWFSTRYVRTFALMLAHCSLTSSS